VPEFCKQPVEDETKFDDYGITLRESSNKNPNFFLYYGILHQENLLTTTTTSSYTVYINADRVI